MNRYPLSKTCPSCGSRKHRKVDPEPGGSMFLNDRICKECGTRYSPPTPRWLPWMLVPLSALVSLVGFYWLCDFFFGSTQVTVSPIYAGLFAVTGLVVGLFSIRWIRTGGDPGNKQE